MSIQTELTRLTNAKAAIQAAIEGKGVTVPNGTLLDGMAALIEAIEAGGGASDVKIAYGTFTPTEQLDITHPNYYTIEHGLGVVPTIVVVVQNHNSPEKDLISLITVKPFETTTNIRTISYYGDTNSIHKIFCTNSNSKHDNNVIRIGTLGMRTTCKLSTNGYIWLAAGGFDI